MLFESKTRSTVLQIGFEKKGEARFALPIKGMKLDDYALILPNGKTTYVLRPEKDAMVGNEKGVTDIDNTNILFYVGHGLVHVDWKNYTFSEAVKNVVTAYTEDTEDSDATIKFNVVSEIRRITGTEYKMTQKNYRVFLSFLPVRFRKHKVGTHDLKPLTATDVERAVVEYIGKFMETRVSRTTKYEDAFVE